MKRHKVFLATSLVLWKDNQILMSLRQNTGVQDGEYNFVAGHVKKSESILEATVREAKEEIGVSVDPKNLELIHIINRMCPERTERIECFVKGDSWKGEIRNMEPKKCTRLKWFELDKLPENVTPFVKTAIEYFRDGVFYSEYGWG